MTVSFVELQGVTSISRESHFIVGFNGRAVEVICSDSACFLRIFKSVADAKV